MAKKHTRKEPTKHAGATKPTNVAPASAKPSGVKESQQGPAAAKSAPAPLADNQQTPSRSTTPARLPNAFRIVMKAWGVVSGRWKLFVGIAGVYALLSLLLVRGFSIGADVEEMQSRFGEVIESQVGTSLAIFAEMASSSGGGSSDIATAYQLFLVTVVSLAVIYALREVIAGNALRIRDGFYKGMYPLVPVILVSLVVLLQLFPFLISAGLYGLVVTSGIAAGAVEQAAWTVVMLVGAAISLYFLSSSIFALYIATLPDMTPLQALRSARRLVRRRRLSVIRKLLFLPLALLVVSSAIVLPVILIAAPLAAWVFFVLSCLSIVAVHAYLYVLYRELLV